MVHNDYFKYFIYYYYYINNNNDNDDFYFHFSKTSEHFFCHWKLAVWFDLKQCFKTVSNCFFRDILMNLNIGNKHQCGKLTAQYE